MKTTLKLSIVALAIFAASCKKEPAGYSGSGSAVPDNSAITNASLNGVSLINLDLVTDPNIMPATENNEFSIVDDGMGDDNSVLSYNAKGKLPGLCFLKCLKGVNLDSNQVHALRGAFVDLDSCRLHIVRRVRAINDSIVHHANDLRKQLLDDYKNGKITKDQLRDGLKKIENQLHDLLKGHAERKAIIQHLLNCYDTFKGELGKILTASQKAAFKSCVMHC